MIIDALMKLSDAQAVTVSAASTNHVDFGSDREVGVGEPLALVVTCSAYTAGTSTTLTIAWQADDNTSFSSARSIAATDAIPTGEIAAGKRWVIPLPPDYRNEQFGRAYFTVGGTGSPSITLDASIQPLNFIDAQAHYADNVTITG